MSQNVSILSPPWNFLLVGDSIIDSFSAKFVRVRTLCIRRLPFLLYQSLLRKAEPVEHAYHGGFVTVIWPFVIVRCLNSLREGVLSVLSQEAEVCRAGC